MLQLTLYIRVSDDPETFKDSNSKLDEVLDSGYQFSNCFLKIVLFSIVFVLEMLTDTEYLFSSMRTDWR